MAVSNLQLFLFVNGRVVKNTKDLEPLFKSLSVSADGNSNGLDITEASGKFDFNGKILGNIGSATAAGQAISYSQRGASNGVASLDSGGKIPASQLPNSVMEFQGQWNATTNSPTLADGTGNAGDVYRVQTAGTQNLGSGAITYAVGDWVMYNGTIWQLASNSNTVVSVNGFQGVVVLTTSDIAEGSNLYYTAARFNTAFAAKSTTDLAEGSNLYYTAARFNTAFAGKSTTDLAEGSNLYFTDPRALAAAVQAGAITSGVVKAPTHDAVFNALALKKNLADEFSAFTNAQGGSVAHTIRQVVYQSSFGNMVKALASDSALNEGTQFAMVKDASIADAASGNYWLPGAMVPGFSGLVNDTPVYLSRTAAGGFVQSLSGFVAGESVVMLGVAKSATELKFNPVYEFVFG